MLKISSVLLVFLIIISGCTTQPVENEGLQAVAGFYPFYDIARNVGGEKADVSVLVPPATEPHAFEPTPGDILRLNRADLFIGTGVDFEEWEDNIVAGLDPNVRLVKANKGVELLKAEEDEHHEEHEEEIHEEEEEEHHHHDHGEFDPHYWVSPKNAVKITNTIKESFMEADSENAAYYESQADKFISELEALDNEYTTRLNNCKQDRVLTTHAAFAYLGNDYGFIQIPILGLSPESEPTPGEIAGLVEEAKEHELKYVFFEELVDPRVAETIASETGTETLVLNPVAGSKKDEGYLRIMRNNLDNLEKALECQ